MKPWFKKGTASLLAFSLLLGSALPVNAAAAKKTQTENLKIASISDTHYLSPTMIKDTSDFTEHLNSDRKMFAESDAFLGAVLDTIKKDQPDVLLISGDLTKDGEREGHELFAEKLENFREKEMPDLHIYIAPGNHDLNNANAMNFNTEDNIAVPAGRTSQQDFKEIYAELTYEDETVTDVFTPAEGKQGGGLSYVARPKDGFTVISIDSARYSADNTESGLEEHETSGAISTDLENWVVEQIKDAKKRGDTVIGVQHHGYVPHFGMEPDILPMYLVNDYDRLSREFADAGMQYVFTGHMHANDIASITTEQGNTLYDIETGSLITYPSPARFVTISRTITDGKVDETMNVTTHTGIGSVTFENPMTHEQQTIEDITAYGKEHGFSNDMLSTTVNGFLHGYYTQIAQAGGTKKAVEQLLDNLLGDSLPIQNITMEKLIDAGLPLVLPDGSNGEDIYFDSEEGGIVIKQKISSFKVNLVVPNKALKQTINLLFDRVDKEVLGNPEALDALIDQLIAELTALQTSPETDQTKTLLDFVNYIYQSHLSGEDSLEQPAWVKEAAANIENGSLLQAVIDVVIENLNRAIQNGLNGLPAEDILGSKEFDAKAKVLVPVEEGRVPLFRPLDSTSANVLGLLFGMILKWPAGGNGFVFPEGSNPEVGYSTGEFLNTLLPLLGIDIDTLLPMLINGIPADEETGTEASEGLLTAERKEELNSFLLGIIQTMGTDDNYPEDNNTEINFHWNLLTDWSALNQIVAETSDKDFKGYTKESVKAVSDALADAEQLSLTAPQEEIDRAAEAIKNALAKLKKALIFEDVATTDYYYDSILWAYENKIAHGYTSVKFNPDGKTTRGEMIAFLWRANGEIKAENTENPFEDVQSSDYYYDAILWAVENGIAKGTDSTHFKPEETITRGQCVSFLYRLNKNPQTTTEAGFKDLDKDAYYYDAVLWAAENEIVSGYDDTTFAPDDNCTRGQTMHILYKAK